MFKPGELARVSQTRLTVTILSGTPKESGSPSLVVTSEGEFEEERLFPAHPSVLATAEGRDLTAEPFQKSTEARTKTSPEDLIRGLDLQNKVEKALKKGTVDYNGHWKSGAAIDSGFKALENMLIMRGMRDEDAAAILQAAGTGVALDRWVKVPGGLRLSGLRKCSFCGEEFNSTETNGLVVRLAGSFCKFPNGLPPTEWDLNVSSGKLVVANDLRDLFPLPEDEDFDINTSLGCRQTALAYAQNGLSHAFVGNSCPGVYRCQNGALKIANEPQDEVWDGEKYGAVEPPPEFDGERLAGVCTDLWWYSLCDQAEFKLRLERFKKKANDFKVEIVDVKPGVYRFHHDEEARSNDGPGERIYSRFEWVREPDPVQDFIGRYEEVEVNAHAYVQAQVARWPTLYGKRKNATEEATLLWSEMTEEDHRHSWQSVADQALCTIGSGVEWHEKGFPTAKTDPSVPDIEPPSFREQCSWYPFSKPYGGLFAGTLTPSFAKLAFRVLESVISFGTTVRDDNRCRDVPYVRARMHVAVARYRELAKQYPDQADPEYVIWLNQEGRAEAWVEKFELGPTFTEKHAKHAKMQRWVPQDAYAIEFDARKLESGHFAWHPKKGGCWANKKDAQRYAINEFVDNGQAPSNNCCWYGHATNTGIPLYSVARVVGLGGISHMANTLVEIAFDYGTPWMQDIRKRKSLNEFGEKAGIRVLSREEYEALLPEAKAFFEAAERVVEA